jgi:LysR family transcriptional regulator, glycine cleavage system transcriptional activator
MTAPSHLKSLQAIEMALRTGSLKEAAEVLGITPAAAGQRVKALEVYLGVDLMVRGRSGLAPSSALAKAMEHLANGFRELESAAELLELQRARQIHLRVPYDVLMLWLEPRLERFRREFPNIAIVASSGSDGAVADCELFLAPPETSEQCDVLFSDSIAALGSVDIAGRVARQPAPAPLAGFPLVHHPFHAGDQGVADWPEWSAANGLGTTGTYGLRFTTLAGALDATLAGAGLIRCGLAMARAQLESGRLVRALEPATAQHSALALVARFRPGALTRPQTRRFRQWLQAEGAETAAWLAAQ